MYNGFGKKGDLTVEYVGVLDDVNFIDFAEVFKKSGFQIYGLEKGYSAWMEAAKGAQFLYKVTLTKPDSAHNLS
jgi:hypothetical protein